MDPSPAVTLLRVTPVHPWAARFLGLGFVCGILVLAGLVLAGGFLAGRVYERYLMLAVKQGHWEQIADGWSRLKGHEYEQRIDSRRKGKGP